MSWTNFWDVNFLDEGGYLVRPHWGKDVLEEYPSLSREYDVFMLSPIDEDKVFAALAMVDLDDLSDREREEIMEMLGIIDDDLSDEEWAMNTVVCCGIESCGAQAYKSPYPQPDDFVISKGEARKWLKELN